MKVIRIYPLGTMNVSTKLCYKMLPVFVSMWPRCCYNKPSHVSPLSPLSGGGRLGGGSAAGGAV